VAVLNFFAFLNVINQHGDQRVSFTFLPTLKFTT